MVLVVQKSFQPTLLREKSHSSLAGGIYDNSDALKALMFLNKLFWFYHFTYKSCFTIERDLLCRREKVFRHELFNIPAD